MIQPINRRRLRAIFLSGLGFVAAIAGIEPSSAVQDADKNSNSQPPAARPRWTNTRLIGSPEPPSPYIVEKVFTKIEWKAPLYVAPEPGTKKLWVVLQGGDKLGASRIVRIDDEPDTARAETLLEIDGRLIYGLTFHPDYETNRLVYLFSNGPTGAAERTNRVTRYSVPLAMPFQWDQASERLILEWRSMGHDGGDLAFGRDRMLYIAAGDGTSDSDTWNSGQDVSNLLATLIRIDVDRPAADKPYTVPLDNPFVGMPGVRPEIWAYGFRNPWRMSIDDRTGDIWVGNNGQDLWETAYLVRRGDNFGWSVYEGNHPFYPNRRRGPTPIVPPTIEHSHSECRSLTGGVVYYGAQLPDLNGAYVYGDYSTGKIWGARHRDGSLTWHRELADTPLQIAAFRVDQRGDLLVVDVGGGLYRLRPRPPVDRPPSEFPTRLSDTGLFESTAEHRVAAGLVPYSVNAPGWADGATGDRFMAIPGDKKIVYRADRGWQLPDGAALVQTLSIVAAGSLGGTPRRLETRVLLKQESEWAGYTYLWNDDQTDATLVGKDGAELSVSALSATGRARPQTWRVPARAECLTCHSRAANFVLGLSEAQMNREHDYGSRPANQIAELHRFGMLDEWPARPAKPPAGKPPRPENRLVNPYDVSQDIERRARSYLHANCSVCHVEAGGGNARIELEITKYRDEMNLFSARPQHDTLGLDNAMLVAPGDPDNSVLIGRISRRGRGQMPPLVTSQVDLVAVRLMRDWIAQMPSEHKFVRAWTVADLAADVEQLDAAKPAESGRAVYEAVGCGQCHRLGELGGTVGPDLNGIGRRLKRFELLEALIEPSKVVADEYATFLFGTNDGKLITGRIEREIGSELLIRTGPGDSDVVRVAKSQVSERRKSAVSNMPAGIVNVLAKNQILDLLAYLLSDGKPDAPANR